MFRLILILSPLLGFLVTCGCQNDDPPTPVARISPAAGGTSHPLGDWPRWSGPQGDLVSSETGWISRWPSTGPGLLWRTNVGIGFSSVSVVDGQLYTMGYRDGKDVVVCLDSATGQRKWTYSYDCELVDNLHEGGPGSTPTVDGDRLYTLSRVGDLFCFDRHTGKVLWEKQMEDEFGVAHPEWGFTCSPLVIQENLVLDVGRTVALDKTTGGTIWQTKAFRPGYGSPRLFQQAETPFIAVLNNHGLLVVRAGDGQVVALTDWRTHYDTSSTTPVVEGETLFISTGYGLGCALFHFDGDQLKTVYQNRSLSNHMNNSVLWGGYLYGFDGQSRNSRTCELVCMKHGDGEVAWRQRGLGCGSLMIADGKLIVLSDQGVLATVEATPTEYLEISRAQVLEGRCWTVPVLAGHRIYCRNAEGDLVCVNVTQR